MLKAQYFIEKDNYDMTEITIRTSLLTTGHSSPINRVLGLNSPLLSLSTCLYLSLSLYFSFSFSLSIFISLSSLSLCISADVLCHSSSSSSSYNTYFYFQVRWFVQGPQETFNLMSILEIIRKVKVHF